VLAVSGELSLRSAGLVRGRLSKALADPGRVLVDAWELQLGWSRRSSCSRRSWPGLVAGRGRAEKCVWAFLPATVAAAYPHTVRTAAHDAVRALLAHGANSPDAATAVEHLVTRQGEHHGPQFVQDMADELVVELVVELAEATAVMATEDEHGGPDGPT